jgi:hypothetical protein
MLIEAIVKDFPDYTVTDEGVVISHKYNKERCLMANTTTKGYLQVALAKDGKCYPKRVHRLVAEAFIPNTDNLPQVNHKDGNKLNNHVENLEWIENKDNLLHSWNIGLRENVREKARISAKKLHRLFEKPVEMVSVESNEVLATFKSSKAASRTLFPNKDKSIVHAMIRGHTISSNRGCSVIDGVKVFFRIKQGVVM